MTEAKFFVGRKKVLIMRTPDGRTVKTGLRLGYLCNDGIEVYDHRSGTWHPMPAEIEILSGGKCYLVLE